MAPPSKVLALLPLAVVAVVTLLLLAHALPPSTHRGGALLLDRLLDLATRRNMVLLCHAILLALLGDAGLLTNPARRRRAEATCHHRRYYSPDVQWRPQAPNRSPAERLQVALLPEHVSTREIVLEERPGTCLDGSRHLVAAGELQQPPAATDVNKTIPSMDFFDRAVVVGDQEKNGAVEEAALTEEFGGEDEEEDLDEMNRRFDAFIAATKEKMRLEALHPSAARNRRVLAF